MMCNADREFMLATKPSLHKRPDTLYANDVIDAKLATKNKFIER